MAAITRFEEIVAWQETRQQHYEQARKTKALICGFKNSLAHRAA